MHTTLSLRRHETFEHQAAWFIIAALALSTLANVIFGFSLPLFLLAGLFAVLLGIISPRSGVLAAVFMTVVFAFFFTLQAVEWGGESYKLYPVDIVLGAALLGALGIRLFRREVIRFRWIVADSWFVAFLLWMTVVFFLTVASAPVGESLDVAFGTWKNYVFYGLLYFLIPILFRTKEEVVRLGTYFLAGCVVSLIFIPIGLIRGQGLWVEYTPLSTEGIRYLDFSHAFYFSLAVLIGVFAWMGGGAERHSRMWRLAYWGLLLAWSFGVVLSLMRHLWFGLFAVCAGMFLVAGVRERQALGRFLVRGVLVFAVFGVVVLYGMVLAQSNSARLLVGNAAQSFVDRAAFIWGTTDGSVLWRNIAWQGAWKVYSEHALVGTGFGIRIPVETYGYQDFVDIRNIHNTWLALLVQTGIIGALTILAFLLSMFRNFLRALRRTKLPRDRGVLLAIAGMLGLFLIVSFFQPYLESNFLGLFFWVALGALRSIINSEAV